MTVVFSTASAAGVVVAADCAITNDFGGVIEYQTGRKHWHVPGLGFLATWGARDGNSIGDFLRQSWEKTQGRSIDDFARSVHCFLVDQYRPDERGLSDVGYHIAGMYADGQPALFHSYYSAAVDREQRGHFDFQVIGPPPGSVQFLYNGRNDLVHPYLQPLLHEIQRGRDTRFRTDTLPALAHLAHFIMRVIAEITPGVAAPFIIGAISPDGQAIRLRYDESPVSLEQIGRDLVAPQQLA